jgi:hypothetical protein
MKYGLLPLMVVLSAVPAIAESWVSTGITTLNGSVLSIDGNSVRRNANDYNRISYRIRLESMGESIQTRISGNCLTGHWRVTSKAQRTSSRPRTKTALISLPDDAGDRSLQVACAMPAQVVTPRPRQTRGDRIQLRTQGR